MSTGRRARRPRAQSPPRVGSPPSGPGPFAPSGRGPRPCLGAGCAVVPAGYCALRCRGPRVGSPLGAAEAECLWVCVRAFLPHWTRDPAGDSPTSRGSLWNEKAQWNLPNNSGSQPRLFRPHGPRLGQWLAPLWCQLESGPPFYLPASLSHLPPFLVPREPCMQ